MRHEGIETHMFPVPFSPYNFPSTTSLVRNSPHNDPLRKHRNPYDNTHNCRMRV